MSMNRNLNIALGLSGTALSLGTLVYVLITGERTTLGLVISLAGAVLVGVAVYRALVNLETRNKNKLHALKLAQEELAMAGLKVDPVVTVAVDVAIEEESG